MRCERRAQHTAVRHARVVQPHLRIEFRCHNHARGRVDVNLIDDFGAGLASTISMAEARLSFD